MEKVERTAAMIPQYPLIKHRKAWICARLDESISWTDVPSGACRFLIMRSSELPEENKGRDHRNDSDKMLAFHRWNQGGPGDDVVIVANFANRSFDTYFIGFPREGL